MDGHKFREMTVRYPEYDRSRRVGIFCEDCGLIMYVDRYRAEQIMSKGCPDCGGNLVWITPDYQPEGKGFYTKYTSTHLMDNICPECGGSGIQIRNDGVKMCPVCGGSG